MLRLVLFTILFCSLSVHIDAQSTKPTRSKKPTWDKHIKLKGSKAKINKADGWIFDLESEKWISEKDEIYNLDNFDKLEFGVGILDNKKYLYLKKAFTSIYTFHNPDRPNRKWDDKYKREYVYILDLDQYNTKISAIDDTSYTEVHLDVLTYKDLLVAPDISAYDFSQSSYYTTLRENKIKEYREILENLPKWEDDSLRAIITEQMQIVEIPFRDRNKLIIKFKADEAKEKVRFFFYTIQTNFQDGWKEWKISQPDNFFQPKRPFSALEITDEISNIMQSDEQLDYFHFEVDYNKFMDFIRAPLEF